MPNLMRNCLEREGALCVLEALSARRLLDYREALLLEHLPLPALADLVARQARVSSRTHSPTKPLIVRRVLFLPLGRFLEESGSYGAFRRGREHLLAYDSTADAERLLFLKIDRWTGGFHPDMLIQALHNILAVPYDRLQLELLGPSSVELEALLHQEDDPAGLAIERYRSALATIGVHALEGGDNLELHRRAASCGFELHIEQELSAEFTGCVASLERARSALVSSGRLRSWSWARRTVDGWMPPTCAEVVRALSAARLMLGHNVSVRAPVALLGPESASIAPQFGADDIGFAAADAATARTLGLPTVEQARSCGAVVVERIGL